MAHCRLNLLFIMEMDMRSLSQLYAVWKMDEHGWPGSGFIALPVQKKKTSASFSQSFEYIKLCSGVNVAVQHIIVGSSLWFNFTCNFTPPSRLTATFINITHNNSNVSLKQEVKMHLNTYWNIFFYILKIYLPKIFTALLHGYWFTLMKNNGIMNWSTRIFHPKIWLPLPEGSDFVHTSIFQHTDEPNVLVTY